MASSILKPKTPATPDPAAERAKAEAEAAQKANSKISMTRRAMRDNSLLTGAGSLGGQASQPGAPAAGRTTLGV
jgi:hypothetical protein